MNERYFDDLTRRVGESTSPTLPRRGLVSLLGGSALAGVAGLGFLTEDAEAKKKKKDKKNKDKKNKDKGKCKADGKKCKKSKDCCDSKCSDGRCGSRCPTRVSFNARWGSFGTGDSQFKNPWDISISRDGEVFVTDTDNRRVQVFNESGSFIRKWGSTGNGSEQFQEPRGVGANQDGSRTRVVVSDPVMNSDSRRLRRFSTSGSLISEMGRSQLQNPRGITIDSNNRIWAVDTTSPGEIYLFNANGDPVTSWAPTGSGQLSNPRGIAVFRDGNNGATYVYVVDTNNDRVVQYQYNDNSSSGLAYINSAGSTGSGSSSFNRPTEISVDTCGNLWVADTNNNRVQVLDENLNFKTRFSASMNRPTSTAVNGSTLYVVNNVGNSVQRFSLS